MKLFYTRMALFLQDYTTENLNPTILAEHVVQNLKTVLYDFFTWNTSDCNGCPCRGRCSVPPSETLAICDQGVELTVRVLVSLGPSSSTLMLAFLLLLGLSFSVPMLICLHV